MIFKVFLVIAVKYDLKTDQIDVITVFLKNNHQRRNLGRTTTWIRNSLPGNSQERTGSEKLSSLLKMTNLWFRFDFPSFIS